MKSQETVIEWGFQKISGCRTLWSFLHTSFFDPTLLLNFLELLNQDQVQYSVNYDNLV